MAVPTVADGGGDGPQDFGELAGGDQRPGDKG